MRKHVHLALFVLVLIAAAFVHKQAAAATPRLVSDCSYTAFTPSESTPFDLDWCLIANADDISLLLDDIAAAWPGAFYVRAPSRTLTVQTSYRAWTATGARVFMFLEDDSPLNRLTIQQIAVSPSCTGSACNGFWKLWAFVNFDTVKIGGPNLSITFVGNHPGFGNCASHAYYATQAGVQPSQIDNCDINKGLLDFDINDGSIRTLYDVRANIRYAQQYAIYARGWPCFYSACGQYKVQQFNVAGVFYATNGLFFHDGPARNVWMDPDRTVITDPYLRAIGWQGNMASGTDGGRPVACRVDAQEQFRQAGGSAYYVDSLTGGVTVEYGTMNWVQRFLGAAGTGVKDPFIVRVQDFGLSGPLEKPCPVAGGCTVGARGKRGFEGNFFKGDPHDYPDTGARRRFVRFMSLTPRNGQGWAAAGTSGCPENYGDDGDSNFARFENSTGSSSYTRDWSVEFAGDWRKIANGGPWKRGDLILTSWDADRVYRNTVRMADGSTLDDTLTLSDTTTATGPGTFSGITIADGDGSSGCTANTVTTTNVSGVVTVSANCGTTTVSNVNFTGSARAVITIGSGSTVAASNLCVPDTSTITGTGTLTYNGSGKALPYTITPAAGCNPATIADPAPAPPTGGSVQ